MFANSNVLWVSMIVRSWNMQAEMIKSGGGMWEVVKGGDSGNLSVDEGGGG